MNGAAGREVAVGWAATPDGKCWVWGMGGGRGWGPWCMRMAAGPREGRRGGSCTKEQS